MGPNLRFEQIMQAPWRGGYCSVFLIRVDRPLTTKEICASLRRGAPQSRKIAWLEIAFD